MRGHLYRRRPRAPRRMTPGRKTPQWHHRPRWRCALTSSAEATKPDLQGPGFWHAHAAAAVPRAPHLCSAPTAPRLPRTTLLLAYLQHRDRRCEQEAIGCRTPPPASRSALESF